jgi:hydrogenase maturation protease
MSRHRHGAKTGDSYPDYSAGLGRHSDDPVLVLGVGNLLMGDEGVGVHVVRALAASELPPDVRLLDGGTGSCLLLAPMQSASTIILIDASIDGGLPGTVRRLEPRFSSDYPRTLTAHDIGLKDLLNAFRFMGVDVKVVLFAVSVAGMQPMLDELSPEVAAALPRIVEMVRDEALRSVPTVAGVN